MVDEGGGGTVSEQSDRIVTDVNSPSQPAAVVVAKGHYGPEPWLDIELTP